MQNSDFLIGEKFKDIRIEIDSITNNNEDKFWLDVWGELKTLKVDANWGWTWEQRGFCSNDNCVSWALGMPPAYHDEIKKLKASGYEGSKFFASTFFVEFLIQKGAIDHEEHPVVGGLVVYFSHERCTHVGRFLDDSKVDSKWGTHPAVITHNLEQVPYSYGNIIKFFSIDKQENIFENYFYQFLEPNLRTEEVNT